MSNSFDKLPTEVFLKIMRYVAGDDNLHDKVRPPPEIPHFGAFQVGMQGHVSDDADKREKAKLAPYATVNRTWQAVVESILFCFEQEPLVLDLQDMDDFARVFSVERRRGYLQRLRLELIVMNHCRKIGRSLLSMLDESSDALRSISRDYISTAFGTLLNVLGSWERGSACLDVEYVIGLVSATMFEDTHPMWTFKQGLRIDVSDACGVDVVRRFTKSEDRKSMGLSPGSLVSLVKKLDGLECTGLDLPLGGGDDKSLRKCQRFFAGLGLFTPFLTDLRLNLDQQRATSFAESERGFRIAVRSLFGMGKQLQHLRLTNVVNPGHFLADSLARSGRREEAAWPRLLSFEISGFYARAMEGDVIRENAKIRIVREMCPRITKYKFAMLIWHKILPPSRAAQRGVSNFSMKYRW